MPLSEHEQRLLEQIERALYEEDPKFASTVSSANLRTHARKRIRRAVVLLFLGLGILFGGVMVQSVPVGVAGFCVMVLAGYATSQYKRLSGRAEPHGGTKAKPTKRNKGSKQPMMKRMEERFRRRFDDPGRM